MCKNDNAPLKELLHFKIHVIIYNIILTAQIICCKDANRKSGLVVYLNVNSNKII